MLTAHSNVLRIYVARFPASSRNFFIPFAPHPRGRRSFVRPRQSVQQPVSFHRAAPGKIPLFDVLFVRRLIFQRSKHEPGNHVHRDRDHLLTPTKVPALSSVEYRTSRRTRGRTAGFRRIGSPAIAWWTVSVCVRSARVNTRTRSPEFEHVRVPRYT